MTNALTSETLPYIPLDSHRTWALHRARPGCRARDLEPGMADNQGNKIVEVRRGEGRVWTVTENTREVLISDAVLVTVEHHRNGVVTRALHPEHIWPGMERREKRP